MHTIPIDSIISDYEAHDGSRLWFKPFLGGPCDANEEVTP